MTKNLDIKDARRSVQLAAEHLADAASCLRAAGCDAEARRLANASHDAASALVDAEGHVADQAPEKGAEG